MDTTVSLVKANVETTYCAGDGRPFLIDPDTIRQLDENDGRGLAYFLFDGA